MATSSPLSIIILSALFLVDSSFCNYRQKLVNYTANLVRYLKSQHPGYFQCLFYHVSHSAIPEDPIIQEVIFSLDTDPVPRMILNAFDSSWVRSEREPIPLVIVHVESTMLDELRWSNFTQMLLAVDSHSRVLVLTSFERPEIVVELLLIPFQYTKTFNVVLISVDREMYVFYNFVTNNVTILMECPTFEMFFPNPTRDLSGMVIKFLPPKQQMMNYCPSASHCVGYDMNVIEQVASFVNVSIWRLTLTCEGGNECDLSSIVMLAHDFARCPFDIYAEQVNLQDRFENHYVRCPLSSNDAFLVPKGRSLNIVELFVKPFRPTVWILLLCGLVVVKIASLFVTGGFQNDVLLLPICGFERFDLNRANQTEKTVIFSLVVLFFLVSNSYEAKFMALMTKRPPAYKINTLEDILRLGLTVKASKLKAALIPEYDFKYIFAEDVNYTDHRLDGVSVYLTNDKRAEVSLLRSENWNFESNQPSYKILDQRLRVQIPFYLLPVRSLIRPAFDQVQKMLFEGGILQLWFWQMINIFYMDGKPFANGVPEDGFAPAASILKFSDLLPMWIVLALGCCVSCVVFVVEVAIRYFIGNYSHIVA